jgi:peptide deformylase
VATTDQPTPQQLARREAALARVRKYGDPVLRERARPVEAVDAVVRDQIREMTRLLDDAMEAGLAATQIGVLNRVFVYRTEIDAEMPEARVLQHELDHLDGVLTLDRTTKEQRREALRELRRR